MTAIMERDAPTAYSAEDFLAEKTKQKRFTKDGDSALETHLDRACHQILQAVFQLVPKHKLEAVMLAGGYGRGEGGVLRTSLGDIPYNDLEFYILIKGNHFFNERRYSRALHNLVERLSPIAGIEIEFKILSLAKLRRSSISMFYYDLMARHRWLWGNPEALDGCEHHRRAEHIPLSEATRLLMNRGAGLLLARERLARALFSHDDADFIVRNITKAQLALGDAILTTRGQYHWSCSERRRRLESLKATNDMPWLDAVNRHHAEGVRFKLHPYRSLAQTAFLKEALEKIIFISLRLWLWVEERRLGFFFSSPEGYAFDPINKCPETNPWRNRLVNLQIFGPLQAFGREGGRYPRERIFCALILMLASENPKSAMAIQEIQKNLLIKRYEPADAIDAFQKLWNRFR